MDDLMFFWGGPLVGRSDRGLILCCSDRHFCVLDAWGHYLKAR